MRACRKDNLLLQICEGKLDKDSVRRCQECRERVGGRDTFCTHCGTKLIGGSRDKAGLHHEPLEFGKSKPLSKKYLMSMVALTVLCLTVNIVIIGLLAAEEEVELGRFTEREICRAGIATIMSKNVGIVAFDGKSGSSYKLHYIRDSDRSRWDFRCYLDGNTLIWATEGGPWRTRGGDAPVNWRVSVPDDRLTITESYADGSATVRSYSLSEVR